MWPHLWLPAEGPDAAQVTRLSGWMERVSHSHTRQTSVLDARQGTKVTLEQGQPRDGKILASAF